VSGDFFVLITAAFRTLNVFVVIEIGSRKVLHKNVTAHPRAEWTLQQFRKRCRTIIPNDSSSTIATASSRSQQGSVESGCTGFADASASPEGKLGMRATGRGLRRECLDFLIPLNQRHLQMIIRDWANHHNRGEAAFGVRPSLPEPMPELVPPNEHRTQTACWIPGCEEIPPRRAASRIWPLKEAA